MGRSIGGQRRGEWLLGLGRLGGVAGRDHRAMDIIQIGDAMGHMGWICLVLLGASVALNAVAAESVVSELEELVSVMAALEN